MLHHNIILGDTDFDLQRASSTFVCHAALPLVDVDGPRFGLEGVADPTVAQTLPGPEFVLRDVQPTPMRVQT